MEANFGKDISISEKLKKKSVCRNKKQDKECHIFKENLSPS